MLKIIRASLFKLLKDWTFRITMFVGLGVAGLLIGISAATESLNGQSLLLSSASPSQNFGLTVPINLIVLTVGEFTFGTLRNKIIAGHTKFKLYTGLFITGLIFTLSLMIVYIGVIVGISSAIGGFDASMYGGPSFIGWFLAYALVTYIFITSFSVFFGTLVRNIGGSISVVVVFLVIVALLPLFLALGKDSNYEVNSIVMWISPLYMLGYYCNANAIIQILASLGLDTSEFFKQTPSMIAAGIITPLYWAAILFVGGGLIFSHRDIK